MAADFLKLVDITGDRKKLSGMGENCWKWLEWLDMAGHGWTWLEWLEMAGKGWR